MGRTPEYQIGAGSRRFKTDAGLIVPQAATFFPTTAKPEFDFHEFRENGIERVGELNPYITLGCDLRCGYCYMYDFLVQPTDTSQLMSPDFLLPMVEFFCKEGNGLDRMTLLGGEPTLHPKITEIVKEVAQMPIKERRMTTNGISPHFLQLDQIPPDTFDHVSISIDGIDPQVNDKTRGTGTFEKVIKTMEEYRQAGVTLSVNYTVTNNNIGTLKDVASFFAEKGVSIVNFHRASYDGNAYNNPDLIVKPRDWVTARDDLLTDLSTNSHNYQGVTVRIPYTFLTPEQITQLGYKPIQEQNYHSPQGGHRLIVFPPTRIGQGLCYMSSDVIGHPNAQLGFVTPQGVFVWNEHTSNEMLAYKNSLDPNVSTKIKGGEAEENDSETDVVRVSHSFKAEITC